MLSFRDLFLTCICIAHVTFGAHTPAVGGVDPSECRSLMDLFIVIDGSDSISYTDFELLQYAIADFVPKIDVGHAKARVGMLVYSSHVPIMSKHPFSDDAQYLVDAALTLQHPRDGTNTALGIEEMTKMFKKYGRKNVPWVCVVITDGISKDSAATDRNSTLAEEMGISMFALGIGDRIDRQELNKIASTPKQVMHLQRFEELSAMLTSMMTTICPCPMPPTLELAKCNAGSRAIGTVRQYECNTGYLQRGKNTIRCQDDFTWTQFPLDFECIPCGATPTLEYGSCGGGEYTLGTRRQFACDVGYLAVGNPEIVCQADATWSLSSFQCIPCGNTPTIKHGYCGGGEYTLDARRQFACDVGYLAVGNPEIVCQADATWSLSSFQCVPCGNTPTIKHGYCGGGEYTLDARRQFACDVGYLAVGNPEIVCQADATWSLSSFQCVPCGNTPTIKHGYCGGGEYTLDARRQFACDVGYLAVGNPEIVCQADATWSLSSFQCVPCGNTPTIKHGYCGGGEYTLDARRQFACDVGYLAVGNPEIVCQADATWSLSSFQCVPCGNTPTIKHGYCGGGEYTLDARRQFACDVGYLAVGNPEIVCQADATWSLSSFQCVPCGNTPTIKHGYCGGGEYTLDARRQFACDVGYLAVGNPEIVCQADATWSLSSFQCVPCGNTPTIKHGYCGGGEYTLDARRQFACDVGYLAVGNPEIVCQADATWSLSSFQCVPCGNTPTIEHGYCGGGEYTLDAKRQFACDVGYLAVGNPDIVCQADATWSLSSFQCVPCGNTPTIEHGYCGGGDYTLDAKRQFACDVGYLAVGNPDIVCQADATWSLSSFQCVPCGNTPTIEHGYCGGGEYTLDAKRQFACDVGYLAVGNPDIVCQADATWSLSSFQCVPCGNTPTIEHGYCGGGEYTLDAKRQFACDVGYLAVGNPDIVCQADATWSLSSFQCVPCGNTPTIDNGKCGGGDFTLLAVRRFTCDEGYHGVGNPEITCQADATWSQTDYKCVGRCGETPVIAHGECDGGDNLMGTRRQYTCHVGYIAVGDPFTECLSNAEWSMPTLECMDCGVPPMVYNAFSKMGPSTIGSRKDYYCEIGYRMYGHGQVECLANGQWSDPQFSCNMVTTTTTTTPKPKPSEPSLCDRCRMQNGVGYNNHPYDCNQYVQCFVGTTGMEPIYRKCPFGQFWDQNVLTCRPSQLVSCPIDICSDRAVKGYKATDRNSCCSYWKCEGGKSYGECCGEGFSYSAKAGQCVADDTCWSKCPFKDELPVGCDKRPIDEDVSFEQHIGGGHWVKMPCAPGTAFNPATCDCSLHLMSVPGKTRQQVCKPEIYLPFMNGFEDRSGNHLYIDPENVALVDGAAFFNGNSTIRINRFANHEFRGNLVIKFRYHEIKTSPSANHLQALVTNGDCMDDPSIVIAKMPGHVLLGSKTSSTQSFAVATQDREWKEVIYMHDERYLEGRVCGASKAGFSYGPLKSTQCGLQIGKGTGLPSFEGMIDDFYVYICRPRRSALSVGY